MTDLLASIQDSLIEGLRPSREVERFGGLLLLRHPTESVEWMNCAIPVGPCTDADVDSLLQRYRELNRPPWLEMFPELSSDLPGLLEAAGLVCLHETPVMILRRDEYVPQPHRDQARAASGAGEIGAGMVLAAEVFGAPPPNTAAQAIALEAIESGHRLAAIGLKGDRIVAFGQAVGNRSIREIAGVATHPDHRSRGFGGAVTRCLLHQFFEGGGGIAWLTPIDDRAESVYAKLGFRSVGVQRRYGHPPV